MLVIAHSNVSCSCLDRHIGSKATASSTITPPTATSYNRTIPSHLNKVKIIYGIRRANRLRTKFVESSPNSHDLSMIIPSIRQSQTDTTNSHKRFAQIASGWINHDCNKIEAALMSSKGLQGNSIVLHAIMGFNTPSIQIGSMANNVVLEF